MCHKFEKNNGRDVLKNHLTLAWSITCDQRLVNWIKNDCFIKRKNERSFHDKGGAITIIIKLKKVSPFWGLEHAMMNVIMEKVKGVGGILHSMSPLLKNLGIDIKFNRADAYCVSIASIHWFHYVFLCYFLNHV